MITIANLIARINLLAPSFNTIVGSDVDGSVQAIDTAEQLKLVIDAALSGRVYPLTMPESPEFPNAVYTLVSAPVIRIDGISVAQNDVYVLSIRAADTETLVTTSDAVIDAIEASTWGLSITDRAAGYDPEQKNYRFDLEVTFSYASFAPNTADMPGVMIAQSKDFAQPPSTICPEQIVTAEFDFYIATSGDIQTARGWLDDALLGYQENEYDNRMIFERGTRIPLDGGITLWRDTYSYQHQIEP